MNTETSLADDILAIHAQHLKIQSMKHDLAAAEDYLTWLKTELLIKAKKIKEKT